MSLPVQATGRLSHFVAYTAVLAGLTTSVQALEVNSIREAAKPNPDPQVADANEPSLFQMGPVHLRPRAAATVTYDDNIFISEKDEEKDVIWTFQPGLNLGIGRYPSLKEPRPEGNYLSLDYTPTFYVFQENYDQNGVDHDLEFASQLVLPKTTLGLRHAFRALSGSDADVGDRVRRDTHTTRLTTHYQATEKTSFDLNATQDIRDYKVQYDSKEWIVDAWMNFHVRPKITLGLGALHGWFRADNQPRQTYQQALVRLGYEATAKLSFLLNLGHEWRQFKENGNDTHFVFDLTGNWRPRDGTLISVTSYRRDQGSAILGSHNYLTTGAAASIRQRFLQRFFCTLSGGYEMAEYHSTVDGAPEVDRDDDYWFARLGVDFNITRRWAFGAFGLHRENSSTDESFDFDNNQVGLQTSVRF